MEIFPALFPLCRVALRLPGMTKVANGFDFAVFVDYQPAGTVTVHILKTAEQSWQVSNINCLILALLFQIML
jgi:hypothetical protein